MADTMTIEERYDYLRQRSINTLPIDLQSIAETLIASNSRAQIAGAKKRKINRKKEH